jgi:hypothetical protein
MITLLEDLRLALRQICRAIGLPGTAATVVPLVVLGVALNIVALGAVEYVRMGGHPRHGHGRTALRSAARTELKVVKAVLTSTLKKIGDGQRRWCLAQQRVMDSQTEVTKYNLEVGFVWAAPSAGEGCDVTIIGGHNRKMATAFVKC